MKGKLWIGVPSWQKEKKKARGTLWKILRFLLLYGLFAHTYTYTHTYIHTYIIIIYRGEKGVREKKGLWKILYFVIKKEKKGVAVYIYMVWLVCVYLTSHLERERERENSNKFSNDVCEPVLFFHRLLNFRLFFLSFMFPCICPVCFKLFFFLFYSLFCYLKNPFYSVPNITTHIYIK